jgi:hypothetical protein
MGSFAASQETGIGAVLRPVARSRLLRRGLIFAALAILLLVLFYTEENHRGLKVWERSRARLLSKGVQLDWHALAPPKVADEENFATTPFFAALFDYVPGTYTPRDLNAYNLVAGFAQTEEPYAEARRSTEPVPPMSLGHRIHLADVLQQIRKSKRPGANNATASVPQNPDDRRETAVELLQALEQFQPVLDELQTASARPQSRFNLNYAEEYPWGVAQPHLPVLERVSRVLAWRGCSELALQKDPLAAEDVALILDLASTLRAEPFQSSFFTRNAMLDNARQIIWEGLADHQWSKSQLSDLQARLQRTTLRDIQTQLQLNRVNGNGVFELVHKQPEIVKGWRFGPSLADKARGFLLRNMPAGWMYLEQAEYQSLFDERVVPTFDLETGLVHPQHLANATHSTFPLWRHRLLADLVLYSARYLCSRAALAQTGLDQAVIACALENHRLAKGQFPATLDELGSQGMLSPPLDVITGEPMKFHRTTDGRFILYSVGWNQKDDGGKTVSDPRTKAPDPEQGDWVWPAYPAQ